MHCIVLRAHGHNMVPLSNYVDHIVNDDLTDVEIRLLLKAEYSL